MIPELYWIPGPWRGRLAISARPRGGDWLEDEVQGWRSAGIEVVVSLLSKDEEEQLDLSDEHRLAGLQSIRFVSFPVTDRSVQASLETTVALLGDIRAELEAGRNVAVHCRQGIGRSALIAAGALAAAGLEPHAALETVSVARGLPVPETEEQRHWLEGLLARQLSLVRR